MSDKKHQIRKHFRDICHKRDGYKCVMCGKISSKDKADEELDVHHITDRHQMPNGGYVKENGISLCDDCHQKAESFHATGIALEGFHPEDLYKKINSNYEIAVKASEKLTS